MKNENLAFNAILSLLCGLGLVSPAFGQIKEESTDAINGTRQEQVIQSLQWRPIGPANMGGRVTDIAGLPGDTSILRRR